jgi:hypothetical protein
MARIHLFSIILASVLVQCCKQESPARVKTDRTALERANRTIEQALQLEASDAARSHELFLQTITEVRSRFGEVAADVLIDRALRSAPNYAPAHLARAESLLLRGQVPAAITEANLALEFTDSSNKVEVGRIRRFLADAYRLNDQIDAVREQRQWLHQMR